jgi:hypothetical protein
MLHTCRNVLKGLRRISSNTEDILTFLGETTCICLFNDYKAEVTYDYDKYKGEIHSIIDQLVSDGYLSYCDSKYNFTITQKGLHPYEFQWDAFKSFLFRSILVPIAVSFATTLITLLVQALLITP